MENTTLKGFIFNPFEIQEETFHHIYKFERILKNTQEFTINNLRQKIAHNFMHILL
jgi:hypothetical protein